jgi:hypothetical protein
VSLPRPRQYTPAQRARAAEVLLIQRRWAESFSPSGRPLPNVLRDGGFLLGIFDNESGMGRIHGDAYLGWFQLSTENPCDMRSESFRQTVADRLNVLGARYPEAMAYFTAPGRRGGTVTRWTEELVEEYFEHTPYIQTVATLESALKNRSALGLDRIELSPLRTSALTYMSHVIPAVARLLAANIDSTESLRSLVARVPNREPPGQRTTAQLWQYFINSNPSVFFGGRLTPMATLDRLVAARFTPTSQAFASLLATAPTAVAETAAPPVLASPPVLLRSGRLGIIPPPPSVISSDPLPGPPIMADAGSRVTLGMVSPAPVGPPHGTRASYASLAPFTSSTGLSPERFTDLQKIIMGHEEGTYRQAEISAYRRYVVNALTTAGIQHNFDADRMTGQQTRRATAQFADLVENLQWQAMRAGVDLGRSGADGIFGARSRAALTAPSSSPSALSATGGGPSSQPPPVIIPSGLRVGGLRP